MDFENYRVVVRVLALAVAWPVWAAGLWLVSKRMLAEGSAPGFGQVARVLAFAQAPGVLGAAILVPTTVGATHVLFQSSSVSARGARAAGSPEPSRGYGVARASWCGCSWERWWPFARG